MLQVFEGATLMMHWIIIGVRDRQRCGKELFDGFPTFSIQLSLSELTRKCVGGVLRMLTSIRNVTTFFQKSFKYFAKDFVISKTEKIQYFPSAPLRTWVGVRQKERLVAIDFTCLCESTKSRDQTRKF